MTICSIRQPTPLAPMQAKLVTAPPQSVSLFLPRKENRSDSQGLPRLSQGKGLGLKRHPPCLQGKLFGAETTVREMSLPGGSLAGPESRGFGYQLSRRARRLRVCRPMHRQPPQALADRLRTWLASEAGEGAPTFLTWRRRF